MLSQTAPNVTSGGSGGTLAPLGWSVEALTGKRRAAAGQTLYATITDPSAYDLAAKVASGNATKAEASSFAKLKAMGEPLVVVADPVEGGTVTGAGR